MCAKKLVITQQYCLLTRYYIESIFPDPICAVHLETGRQFVAFVFGVVYSVGIVRITACVTCSYMSFL